MSTSDKPRFFLVLPAAGAGQRMRQPLPKQYQRLLEKPLLQHTLERVARHACFSTVVVAIAQDDVHWPSVETALPEDLARRLCTVTGGADRASSVQAALDHLAGQALPEDWILVHDAVRPCLEMDDLERLFEMLQDEPVGGILATPVRETVKSADARGCIAHTVERERLWLAATPQMFRHGVLTRALAHCRETGFVPTDEAAAVERWSQDTGSGELAVRLVPGRATNIKVTYPEDIHLASLLLGASP